MRFPREKCLGNSELCLVDPVSKVVIPSRADGEAPRNCNEDLLRLYDDQRQSSGVVHRYYE